MTRRGATTSTRWPGCGAPAWASARSGWRRRRTSRCWKLPYASTFGQRSHPTVIELAEKLISLMPVPMSKVFFNNSGSEANDTAVKLVWYYNNALGRPRKKKIIGRDEGLSRHHHRRRQPVPACPTCTTDFDLPIANVRHTDCPHYYRYGKPGESEEEFAIAHGGEPRGADRARRPGDGRRLHRRAGAGRRRRDRSRPRTYFEKIQAVLRKHDMLFIADEVICGFGRTGNMFGCETFGIEPDIMTCAKALSSAYLPISAMVINEKLYQGLATQADKIGSFGHGFTYSGHPVCAAVALETLKIYEERDIVGHVRKISPRFLAGVRRFADHPLVGEVRAIGLMAGIELVSDKATKQPFDAKAGVGAFFEERALAHGLIMRGRGEQLVMAPPLIITEAEIDDLLGRFARALDETAKFVASLP